MWLEEGVLSRPEAERRVTEVVYAIVDFLTEYPRSHYSLCRATSRKERTRVATKDVHQEFQARISRDGC